MSENKETDIVRIDLTPAQKDRLTIKEAAHKPGEWFTQEVTAVGPKITIQELEARIAPIVAM